MSKGDGLRRCGLVLAAVVALAVPPAAAAGSGSDDERVQARPAPDFLFREPRVTIGLRGSLVAPRASSDLFDFVTSHLTIDKADFRGGGFATDVGVRFGNRVEVVAGIETSQAAHDSEYRDFVDNLFLPIEQSTSLKTFAATVGARVALAPRGRRISQLAWIPRTVTPYVGAGGGLTRYDFEQRGDFVDFADFNVFSDVFYSKGWTPNAYLSGGADVRLFRQLYLNAEGRYTWASAALGDDFVGFDPIDLSGFRLSFGISLLF
jgi:hypothetical protein